MSTITIGVNLAKHLFSVCEMDGAGHVAPRQDLRRDPFGLALAQLPAGTVVAMEACSGAHYWARRCEVHGLQPRIIAAQFVIPFRKSRRTKNDRADAEAIATAARQGNMRFVPVKSADQQVRLSWHRVREGYKVESLAIGNRIRGLLAEFGVVVAQSDVALQRLLSDLEAQAELPAEFKELLRDLANHWGELRMHLDACDARIELHARDDERCVRLRSLVGVGPLTADAAVATVGNAGEFNNGRRMAAWLAGTGPRAAFQWRARATGPDQLPRRFLPANPAHSRRTQHSATRQSRGAGESYARTIMDTLTGWPHAVRQSAGRHCQQTRQTDLGDVGP